MKSLTGLNNLCKLLSVAPATSQNEVMLSEHRVPGTVLNISHVFNHHHEIGRGACPFTDGKTEAQRD